MSDNSVNASLTPPGAPSPGPSSSSTNSTPAQTKQPDRSFADVAVERGYCTAAQIAKVRDAQRKSGILVDDMSGMLVKEGILSLDQARACERALKGVTVIAGFEILEKVGQGGMGAVFRARQISMDRIVALKVLPPKLAQDALFKKRFMHEARLSAKLSHLNIISGIDCGEAGGYTYFAMEYVDGKTLKQIQKAKGKFPPIEAFGIIRQMVVALVYAQTHGLVHRDIKPDNIMMTTQGVAKLCDLGLAKQTEAPEDASMTQAGQAVGTPHYISPEQARGEKLADARSDIYSLGCTFYHMLAGKTPFDAPTGASVMALHITEEAANPCDADPAIPLSYGRIISKMMAKKVEDRYANAQALLDDLDATTNGNIPKAVGFKSKTSCAMPRKASKTEGPLSPVPAKSAETETSDDAAPDKRKMMMAGAAILVLAVGAFMMSGNKEDEKPPVSQGPSVVKAPDKPTQVTPPVKTPDPVKTPTTDVVTTPPVDPIKTPVVVKTPPETSTKPPDEVAPPDPVKVVTPVKPPEVPANVVSSKPVVAEAAYTTPKLELGADLIYARALMLLANHGPTTELSKLETELRDLTVKSEFLVAREDINAELADMAEAVKFEQAALKAMAAAGGQVDLNEDTARKFNAKQGKITGYDTGRGLKVDVMLGNNRIGTYISATALPLQDILMASPDKSALGHLRYLAARGQSKLASPYLEKLTGKDQERWTRKLKLLSAGPNELLAEATYANLAKLAEEKKWKAFQKLADEFDKLYGTSNIATDQILVLTEWKMAAKKESGSTEGLEGGGKFVPQIWPKTNPAVAKMKVEKENGNKILTIESAGGEGEKCALTHDVNLDLSGKVTLTFRTQHNNTAPLKVAFGFFTGDAQYFETAPVPTGSKVWHENTIQLDGSVFKGPLNGYSAYDQELTGRSAIKRIAVLVYAQEPYQLEIDSIVLK